MVLINGDFEGPERRWKGKTALADIDIANFEKFDFRAVHLANAK